MDSNKTQDVTTAEEADLISELSDDVLLHIFSFLTSAADVARASVLSKRWRHLWNLAPCLHFAIGPGYFADEKNEEKESYYARRHEAARRRLIAGVDTTVARRVEESRDVDVMDISLVYTSRHNRSLHTTYAIGKKYYFHPHHHEADIMLSRVDTWLRFAERHVKDSFTLVVPLVAPVAAEVAATEARRAAWLEANTDYVTDEGEIIVKEQVIVTEEEEEEVVHVEEGEEQLAMIEEEKQNVEVNKGEVVKLPCSTKDVVISLTLGYATIVVPPTVAGAFHALSDFTLCHAILHGHLLSSSCCPQLRRLRLKQIGGLTLLWLDAADTLEELWLVNIPDLQRLEINAGGLRLLRVFVNAKSSGQIEAMMISTPKLEELACNDLVHPDLLQFTGAATIRCIKKLLLFTHGSSEDAYTNAAAVWLLKNCVTLVHLDLKLFFSMVITNFALTASVPMGGHSISATVARYLAKCNGIEHLSIDIRDGRLVCSDPDCICDQPEDWEEHMIPLENLKDIEIRGFMPFIIEKDFCGYCL
uniref:F-box domain-containing protein n=1 Tax=Leersia perrieri TaxID=77586 RepID=A0A0D9XZW1_9ORYZ